MSFPPPRAITLHRDIEEHIGETGSKIFAARVVNRLSSQGRRQRRLLVVTFDFVILCETNGTVRRVHKLQDIREVQVKGHEVLIHMVSTENPCLLYVEIDDPRNCDSPPALQAIRELWAHRNGMALPVAEAAADVPLRTLGRFDKGSGYQSPTKQLANINRRLQDDIRSPTPTDSAQSELFESPPRPNSPVHRKTQERRRSPPASGHSGVQSSALASQLEQLREHMRLQEDQFQSLQQQNQEFKRLLETRDAQAHGKVEPDAPVMSDSYHATNCAADSLQREIDELRLKHARTEEAEEVRRRAAAQAELLHSPPRVRDPQSPGSRYVVLRGDQVPPDAALPSLHVPPQGSPRFVVLPSPRRNRDADPRDMSSAHGELLEAQERNRQLEARNRQLEEQLRAANEAAEALRGRDRELRREQRRQERRRRETEAEAQMLEAKEQIRELLSKVEDYEQRNRDMAETIQRVASPARIRSVTSDIRTPQDTISSDFLNRWPPASAKYFEGRLRTPPPAHVQASDPDLLHKLAMLRSLRNRGAPGLDPAIAQLEAQISA